MESKKPLFRIENYIEDFSNTKTVSLLFVLTLALRLIYLDFYSLNIDEPFTVYYAQMPLKNIGQMLQTENNPPLFFLILHYWMKVFGVNEFSVRFLPALFSAITVVFMYKIGYRFFSTRLALAASFLFIFSAAHFEFSHDCRAYTLLVLLSTISIYYLLKLLILEANFKTWIYLGLCNTLLVYTHFIGWVVIFVEIVIILTEVKKERWKNYFFSYLITFITLLPYFAIFIKRVKESTNNQGWIQKPIWTDLYTRLWEFSNRPLVTVIFLAVLLAGFFLIFKQKEKLSIQLKVMLLWFLLPYLGLFFVSLKLPLFIERYLLVLSIPYYFLIITSIELLAKKANAFKWLYLLLPLLMLFSTQLNPNRKRPNKQLVQLLVKLKGTQSTAILIQPEWYAPTFLYYYNQQVFCDYSHSTEKLNEEGIFPFGNYEALLQQGSFQKYQRILYFQTNPNLIEAQNKNLDFLKSKFKYISTVSIYNCKLSVLNRY